jgi:hypothetical protein
MPPPHRRRRCEVGLQQPARFLALGHLFSCLGAHGLLSAADYAGEGDGDGLVACAGAGAGFIPRFAGVGNVLRWCPDVAILRLLAIGTLTRLRGVRGFPVIFHQI